jgi:tetratricopeptide (TPR) repeat protein
VRAIAQRLLTEETELDPDVCSTLYWLSEIYWFTEDGPEMITDFESTIRYLYHLCFINPERAGFLEIDSQFFSQFEVVNELAQEGFLFRETLIEKLLELWRAQEGLFDGLFRRVLESMTQRASKIYDERENWEMFWNREKDHFDKDYLYVVEGNLSYAAGRYDDARICYEKALKISPRLRSALLNVTFCYARLGAEDKHHAMAERIVLDKELHPTSLFVAGDSYLLIGNDKRAEIYFSILSHMDGWSRKVDYYKSTFCFENKLFELALRYAQKAHLLNPTDTSMSYHLSLCYNAVGQKDHALDLVKLMPEAPQWVNYYRFTLERDSGRHHEASNTLLQIPHDYFQDPDELEAALDFAKHRQDLVLLRHLRRKE